MNLSALHYTTLLETNNYVPGTTYPGVSGHHWRLGDGSTWCFYRCANAVARKRWGQNQQSTNPSTL